jgi:hypothetical protein
MHRSSFEHHSNLEPGARGLVPPAQLGQDHVRITFGIVYVVQDYLSGLRGAVDFDVSELEQTLPKGSRHGHVLDVAQRDVAHNLGDYAVPHLELMIRERVHLALPQDVVINRICERDDRHPEYHEKGDLSADFVAQDTHQSGGRNEDQRRYDVANQHEDQGWSEGEDCVFIGVRRDRDRSARCESGRALVRPDRGAALITKAASIG